MSTHVDGAGPSVPPDESEHPDVAPEPMPGPEVGSDWVRAEMQRRMAASRSTRGRHARRGELASPAQPAPGQPSPGQPLSGQRGTDTPPRGLVPGGARPAWRRPDTPPPWAPVAAPATDLPENYVPRHSVHAPGPAADPVSGPIPAVRPVDGPAEENGAASSGHDAGPIGGPSLSPAGLPMRRRRGGGGGGPGTPLQADPAPAAESWLRPGPIVPHEPARRLGAPPEILGAPDPIPAWGLPLASPPRGFPAPVMPAAAPAAAAPVAPALDAEPDADLDPDETDDADDAAVSSAPAPSRVAAEDDDEDDDGYDDDEDGLVVWRAGDDTVGDPPAGDAVAEDAPVADEADDPDPDGPDDGPSPSLRLNGSHRADGASVHAPARARTSGATDVDVLPADAAAPAEAPAPPQPADVPGESPAETTDEIAGGITDSPTAPHPIVLARRAALSGRPVGVPAQRITERARAVPPRPPTPRNIPVVGTAPPEPGSTRIRVVLAERKGVARPVRTIKEVQEGTAVGDLLRRDLIRSQLLVTVRFALLTVLVLGALPAVFALLPVAGQARVLGVGLPWVVLGVLMYPFLVGVAWRYTRVADRVEQNFADHVQD